MRDCPCGHMIGGQMTAAQAVVGTGVGCSRFIARLTNVVAIYSFLLIKNANSLSFAFDRSRALLILQQNASILDSSRIGREHLKDSRCRPLRLGHCCVPMRTIAVGTRPSRTAKTASRRPCKAERAAAP